MSADATAFITDTNINTSPPTRLHREVQGKGKGREGVDLVPAPFLSSRL